MKRRVIFLWMLILLGVPCAFAEEPPDHLKVIEGKDAPSLEGVTWVSGEKPETKGSPYVLYFFDPTQEEACRFNIERFNRLAAKLAESSLAFIGLALDGDTEATREAAKKCNANHPIAFDAVNVTDQFGFGRRWPYVVMVTDKGKIEFSGLPTDIRFGEILDDFAKRVQKAPLLTDVTINALWELSGRVQKLDFGPDVIRELKSQARSRNDIFKREANIILEEIDKYCKKRLDKCIGLMKTDPIMAARLYLWFDQWAHLPIRGEARKALADFQKENPELKDEVEAALLMVEADILLDRDQLPWIVEDRTGVSSGQEWDAKKMQAHKKKNAKKASALLNKLKRYKDTTNAGKEYDRLESICKSWDQ